MKLQGIVFKRNSMGFAAALLGNWPALLPVRICRSECSSGTPEENANASVFIGSDKASYIIGASVAVNGGMIAG